MNLTDDGLPASRHTGLVYTCPIGPGECEGIRGDTSRYLGAGLDEVTDGFQSQPIPVRIGDLFSQPIAEGRLFDQARKQA